jgi:hypothetical protein
MVERRLIALVLSGFFLMSVLPFSPSVSFDPLQMDDDDEGQALSEQQIVALESLPASVKVSGRTGNSTVETLQWAVKAASSFGHFGSGGIAVDSSGNAFVTGSFSGNATLGNTTLINSGLNDVYIAKLSSSGEWQWAVRAGGSSHDDGNGIALDSSGNIYVTGIFGDNATFGNTSLIAEEDSDIFVAKLSNSGSWLWAVKAGGTRTEYSYAIAVDSSDNVLITGCFRESANFGSKSITTGSTSGGGTEIFVAKISSSGEWQWATKASEPQSGGSQTRMGKGITVDSSGSAFITGYFTEIVTFGSTTLEADSRSRYVAKISSSGIWQWAVKASGNDGGYYYDHDGGIAVDSSGNAFVTGGFSETATFGSTVLLSSGDRDIFVAKISSNGIWQWAVSTGGSQEDEGNGVTVDSSGSAFITGYFTETVTFGSTTLTSSGKDDIFVAKISSSGIWQWAVKAGGSGADEGWGIAVDSSSNAYVFGVFTKNATFGSTILEQDFVYSGGGYTHYDHFVAKFLGPDVDGDGVQNPVDNCVYDANADQADYDSDNIGDVCDPDADGDDVLNVDDMCPMGMNTWVSNSTNDNDGDGCNDSYEDLDDDNDGISDETEVDTGSNPLDPDSDADGYQDGEDAFPTDSTEWNDSDGDGFGDNSDACPDVFGTSLHPVTGCLDSDSDGWADDSDAFPYDPEEWSDSDLDEVGDNSDAFPTDWKEWNDSDNDLIGDNSDACPDVFGTSLQPIPGCPDSDSDGWADSDDEFPNDDSEWIDSDADGVGDNADSCPLEFGTSTQIGRYGCPEDNELDANETLDSDGDGVEDNSDNCPGTTNNTVVDLEGCIITTKSTSDTASNFLSEPRTWTAIIALFVAIIGVAFKVRSGGRGSVEEEENVAQQAFGQTNPTMNSLSKPSAQVMANNGIENGYELLYYERNNYYRIPGSWSEWTQYQR